MEFIRKRGQKVDNFAIRLQKCPLFYFILEINLLNLTHNPLPQFPNHLLDIR